MTAFRVGQEVLVTGQQFGPERVWAGKVAKVGRVWGTLASGKRFDLETGALDGGRFTSPGRVHTPEGYKLHRERVQRDERVRAAGMDLYRSPLKNNEDFLDELDALIRKHEGERP